MAAPYSQQSGHNEKLVDMGKELSGHHLKRFIEDTLEVTHTDVRHMVLTIVPPGRVLVVLTRYERNEDSSILIEEFESEPSMETRYGEIEWDWEG